MNATRVRLLAILGAGLVLRLLLLSFVQNPGLHDPLHYYNLGRRIAQGQGFTIDYVWHYSRLPDEVTHPIDHWMPLAGVAAAAGIRIGGEDAKAAAAVFLVAGALLPLLVFAWSKQLHLSDKSALIAAAFACCASGPGMEFAAHRYDDSGRGLRRFGNPVFQSRIKSQQQARPGLGWRLRGLGVSDAE